MLLTEPRGTPPISAGSALLCGVLLTVGACAEPSPMTHGASDPGPPAVVSDANPYGDRDCAYSGIHCCSPCEWFGACKRLDSGSCGVVSEKDCLASDHCLDDGRCDLLRDKCTVLSDASCRQSKLCLDHGLCYGTIFGDYPNDPAAGITTTHGECVPKSQWKCRGQCDLGDCELIKGKCREP